MYTFTQHNNLLLGITKINYDPNKLVLVYDTSKEPANNTVSFPVNGTSPNITIDWGDNTSDVYTTTGWKTHTYASSGIYTVQVSGNMKTLSFGGDAANTNNKLKLVRCLSFGNIGLTSLIFAFRNCTNFIEAPKTLPSSITNLNGTFMDCTNFNSNITNIANLFDGCSIFNQPIGNWNTTNVTITSRAFARCTLFNQPIDSWNMSNAGNMGEMFTLCRNFNQPLGNWNLVKATNLGSMFSYCNNFNQPIGNWNTSNVRSMASMFLNATSFNQPIGNWNTSNVNNMLTMFNNANSFSQDISSWDIRKVVNMTVFMSSSNWGTANYDAALTAWADLPDTDLMVLSITSFASSGSNTRVTVSSAHGMVIGSRVNISGTTNYNGDYNVIAVPTFNTFDIAKTFTTNDATGTMKHRRSRNVTAGFGTNKYSAGTASTKRDILINTYNWTITDGGLI